MAVGGRWGVAVVPDFEPLSDTLRRVLATANVREEEAKRDICAAVADGKIALRVRVAASSLSFRGQTFPQENVGVPKRLKPDDFDWVQSRPLKPWWIGPQPGQHYFWDGE